MNIRTFSTLLLLTISTLALLSNKNGRAATASAGNTGAPGDATNANGTAQVCGNCHSGGSITATMNIKLFTTTGDSVTKYEPGKDYIVRVKINGSGTGITGYGFQMIPLRNSNNTDIKGMSDFGGVTSNNYKISTINSTARTYAEQSTASPKDTFNIRWKAPVAGTGAITFYAAGNAVNGNNGTGGDGAATATLVLQEATTNTNDVFNLVGSLKVSPNPVVDQVVVSGNFPESGTYQLSLMDSHGKQVWAAQQAIGQGQQALPLQMLDYQKGIYFLTVSKGSMASSVKVLKI